MHRNKQEGHNITEQHLFILWENARTREKEILEDVKSQFKIIKEIEIEWDKENFLENLTSFYGFNHSDRYFLQEERGSGKFLVIIVQDNNPEFIKRQTTKGETLVNKKMFEIKYKIREKYFNGKFLIHATNNSFEMHHDICLLLGKNLEDLNKEAFFDGKRIKIRQNLPAIDGWKSQEQIFYILNETVNYVLIRDIDDAPFALPFPGYPNSGSYYYDFEILTDDVQSLRYILAPTQNYNEFAFGIFVDLNGKEQPFHVKYLGDRYFDINIEKKLLETKKKNKNNVWVVGNDEYYFYTLLYHGIIHKENYKKYDEIFSKIAPQIGITDYKCDETYLSNLLYSWMKKNDYMYHQTIDMNGRTIFYKNIPDKKQIDNSPIQYIFQTDVNLVILTSDLIIRNPNLATSYLKNMNVYFKLHEHILTPDHKLYKEFNKTSSNEIAWFYRKRFGRIVKTTTYLNKNGAICFKRDILGFPQKCENKYLEVIIEKNRKFINGENIGSLLAKIKSETKLKVELEQFFGEVFRQFTLGGGNSMNLSPIAWDAVPFNCIRTPNNEYKFFDLEYKLKFDIPVSYFIWRAIVHTPIRTDKGKLYNYFCKKYSLPNMFHYYQMFDNNITNELSLSRFPLNFQSKKYFIYNLVKKLSLFLVMLVFIKKVRKKWKEKIKIHFDYPNRKIMKRYFIN